MVFRTLQTLNTYLLGAVRDLEGKGQPHHSFLSLTVRGIKLTFNISAYWHAFCLLYSLFLANRQSAPSHVPPEWKGKALLTEGSVEGGWVSVSVLSLDSSLTLRNSLNFFLLQF